MLYKAKGQGGIFCNGIISLHTENKEQCEVAYRLIRLRSQVWTPPEPTITYSGLDPTDVYPGLYTCDATTTLSHCGVWGCHYARKPPWVRIYPLNVILLHVSSRLVLSIPWISIMFSFRFLILDCELNYWASDDKSLPPLLNDKINIYWTRELDGYSGKSCIYSLGRTLGYIIVSSFYGVARNMYKSSLYN